MSSTRLSAFCSRLIEAGWIAAVVLVPLYFNVYSSRVFEPDKLTLLRSIALFMSAAWLIKVVEEVSRGQRVFRISWRTPLVLVTLVLVAVYLISTLVSVTPYASLWGSYQRLQGTYTTLAYIVVFFLVLNEMRHRAQLDRLVTAAIITSVPISLYGLIQHYGIDPLPWGGDVTRRVASNMGNAIFISAYLIMIFFLTLGRIVESFIAILTEEEAHLSDIFRAAAYIFTAMIQLITIYFSQSRGPWVGLMVGAFTFVLFGLLALRRAAPDKGETSWNEVLMALGGTALMATVVGFVGLLASRRTWKWLWLSWVLLAIVAANFLVLFNLPDTPLETLRDAPYIGRLGRVFQTESGSGKVRVLIWEGVVDMITPHPPLEYPPDDADGSFTKDNLNFLRPLVGYGPESMYVAYNRFYPSELAHYEQRNASPDRSHNETFDALVISGVVGLVTYMVLFGSIFYYGLKWLGWIENKRQMRAFLVVYLLAGLFGAVGAILAGGAEFFGVGLPLGFTIGLVLYAILHALFEGDVQPLAFVLFWGIVSALAVAIVLLTGSGFVVFALTLGVLVLVGALFYLLGRITFRENDESEVEAESSTAPPILMLSLFAAIIAHFVEIHFGIAIAATRTYFWVYAAVLVLLGTGVLRQRAKVPATEAAAVQEAPPEAPRKSRRKRRRRSRRPRPRTTGFSLPNWLGPVLASALVLVLVMGTLGFDFVTNSGRISLDPTCDPQAGRTLVPCWSGKAWEIVQHDLTVLPARGSRRPEATSSFMTLGLFLLTLLIGSVVTISEMARRGLFKGRSESVGWGTLLLVSVAVVVTLMVLLNIADRHLQLGRLQRNLNATTLITGLLDVSMYLSSILVAFYTFVFLFIVGMGLVLLIGRRLPQYWATPWGLIAFLPVFIIAFLIMNQTNVQVIRADVVYKQGEEFSRQGQWDIAIAHHKRALELAPNEDFYYLWAGSAYLEKSKSAPQEGCVITGDPDISGILSMSAEKTAQLCSEDLLTAARTILLEARHVNPLNTDHSANLGRLYRNWAELGTSAEERARRIDQAISYYNQAINLSPQNTIVWNELALVHLYQQRDIESAQAAIQQSLELDERYEQTYLLQGDLLVTEADRLFRQAEQKRAQLESAAEDEKAAIEAEVERLLEEREEKLEAAIASYEQAIELKPRLTDVYATVANAYEQMGRLEQAETTYRAAAEANPRAAQPYIGLAGLYQRQGDSEAAITAYRRAVALSPGNVQYRVALANLLESEGRLNEALVEVQEAARAKPDDPALRQSLAFMYQRLQMYPEALAEAQAAAQLAPNNPTAQLLIGDISRTMNDLQTATAAYERALALAPNLENAWNVHLNLALIYRELGQVDLALAHGKEALNLAPEGQRPGINDFIAQLQSSGTP